MSPGHVEYSDFQVRRTTSTGRAGIRGPGFGYERQKVEEVGRVTRVSFSSPAAMALHMLIERGYGPEELAPVLELVDRDEQRTHELRAADIEWGQRYMAPYRERMAIEAARGPGFYDARVIWQPTTRRGR